MSRKKKLLDPAKVKFHPMLGVPDPEEVIALRHKMKASRRVFGELVGYTDSAVVGWELGRNRMPAAAWAMMLLINEEHPSLKLNRMEYSPRTVAAPGVSLWMN
jgi:DNA-binding transcriptional regulator YiaG